MSKEKSVTIYTTSKCNISCKHCGVGLDQDSPRPQQTTEELKTIFYKLSKDNTKYITILGGEATVYRRDLAELLDYADTVGLKVSINTNLTVFHVVQPLLAKPALKGLIVSIDGITPATHDSIRGKGTFQKTITNIKLVSKHERVLNGDLHLEMAFVMAQINVEEAPDLIDFAKEVGATRLNIKNVKLIGRAFSFAEDLGLDLKKMLNAYSLLVVNWMLSEKKIEMEILVTPSFATYLNRRFQLTFPTTEHHACGGESIFSYVDLHGNHLPCPSLAYEENPTMEFSKAIPGINLLESDVQESYNSDLFREFESYRAGRSFKSKMFPCKFCSFQDQCVPCTAQMVGGGKENDTVDICSALFEHADQYLPGFRKEIWPHYNELQNESLQKG
ncbi:MAG: Radical domain protein [Bacteroidetes bacterium]|nr:Radical domain protein [Bacteroidota bacterium]